MKLPRMTRLSYALARCSLPGCPRQAAYIGGLGFKLCSFHSTLFRVGAVRAEAARNAGAKSFDLDAVGELDEHGDLKKLPRGEK